jgi:RimJ/RimL family protein N-acetyltransferase
MKQKDNIAIDVGLGFILRAATLADIEQLRVWKNAQRKYFFHQEVIEPEQQRAWFDGFLQRSNDYMLILEHQSIAIGCMGIRLLDMEWDVYNVILGDAAYGRKGHMRRAFAVMLDLARKQIALPITLKVLKHNPALDWYLKNGFSTVFVEENHLGLRFQAPTMKGTNP